MWRTKTGALNTQRAPHSYYYPWEWIENNSLSDSLTRELHSEIHKKHPLHWTKAFAIARNLMNDDVLFEIENDDFCLAMVHLTWTKESLPEFPSCDFFRDFTEFEKYAETERKNLSKSH